MANDIHFSGVADGDLSTRQYQIVRLSGTSGNAFEVTGTTGAIAQRPLGILQDDPNSSGTPADVLLMGISKVRLGGNVTQGDLLGSDSFGRLITVGAPSSTPNSTAAWVVGSALQSGNTTSIIMALIHQPYILQST